MWSQVDFRKHHTNKASGGDGIPVELSQILKDDAVKVLQSICQQIGNISSGHGTESGFNSTLTVNFQMFKLDWGKAEEPEIKLPKFVGSLKKQESSKIIVNTNTNTNNNKTYFCFTDYAKAFDCMDHNKLWKILKDGIPDHLTCLLRNLYAGQEATVRIEHGTTDWFQIGKGIRQVCILSPC